MFGSVVGTAKTRWHFMAGEDTLSFGRLILDIYMRVKPCLNIMDGIMAMEGNGPGNGTMRPLNLVALSRDGLALDLTVSEIMGM